MQKVPTQLNGTSFYDALTAVVMHKPSGIVAVKHEDTTRKLFFHQGHCLSISSTHPQELPGFFLHQQKYLSKEQYDRYMHQAAQPNARQWDLATTELAWTQQQLFEAQKKHLFYVLTRLGLESPHQVSFKLQNFPETTQLLSSSFSMLLFKSSHWSRAAAQHRLPFLGTDQDAKLTWTSNQHAQLLPQEAKQLRELIHEKTSWKNLLRQSNLTQARLQTWVLFFTSLDLVQIHSDQKAPATANIPIQGAEWGDGHIQNIQTFGQKLQEGGANQAIDFAHQQWLKDRGQHRLSIILIEAIFNHHLIQEKQYQKMAFSILEYNMQHFGTQYESFFLLGKLCYLLGQPVHAIKALSRALNLRPDLGSLRDFIIQHAGNFGPRVALESLSNHVDNMNHYSLLGVDSQASTHEITLAYRQCCKHFHPDRFYRLNHQHTSQQAKNVFKKMAAAYRTLKHPRRRHQYDLELSPNQSPETAQAAPISLAAKPFYELGILKMREKDFESAIFQFRMANQLDPNHRVTQDKLALAKSKQEEKERV